MAANIQLILVPIFIKFLKNGAKINIIDKNGTKINLIFKKGAQIKYLLKLAPKLLKFLKNGAKINANFHHCCALRFINQQNWQFFNQALVAQLVKHQWL